MKPEFIESELELFVQRILVHEFYAFDGEYIITKISPGAEALRGYDAKIIGVTEFYCQFKTSNYLSRGSKYKKREKYCENRGWPIKPAYSFDLRLPSDKKKLSTPSAWQHNILHSLWRDSPGAVAYVSPTFHTRLAMQLHEPRPPHMHCELHRPLRHWRSHIGVIEVEVNGRQMARIPAFEGLVSIPPHEPVKSLSHSYFYTSHSDVSFHSEPSPVEGAIPFGAFLKSNVKRAIEQSGHDFEMERLTVEDVSSKTGLGHEEANMLLTYGESLLARPTREDQNFSQLSPMDQRLVIAYGLEEYFDICTFGICKLARDI